VIVVHSIQINELDNHDEVLDFVRLGVERLGIF
jgi:hypothetical protein